MPDKDDEEDDGIDAITDALDQAKRAGEFAHWRAAKLRKRMKKRFADKEAQIQAMIVHEREMIRKKALRRERAFKEELRKQHHERMEVLGQQKNLGGIMTAACKTWEAEEKIREVTEDVEKSTGKMHDKMRSLDDLSHRINKLRGEIAMEAKIKTATLEVQDDLDKINMKPMKTCPICKKHVLKTRYNSHYNKCLKSKPPKPRATVIKHENHVGVIKKIQVSQCSICERPVMSLLLEKHVQLCSVKEQKRQRMLQSSYEVPQPPQNFRVAGHSTCWSIPLAWEPPLFDGGQPVFEYEINYSICNKTRDGKKIIRQYEKKRPVLTSRWTLRNPVQHFGHTLKHLSAGEEYVELSVRARNNVGWSEPSNMIKTCTLKAVEEPSPPLFFGNRSPGVTECALYWCKPLRHGGSPIVGYRINYKFVAVEEVQGAGFGGAGEEAENVVAIDTESTDLSYTLKGLVSGIEYTDISVQAINANGLVSEPSNVIPKLVGAAAGRIEKFRQDLMRATKSTSAWIDSDLFYGFQQRFGRRQYIKLVKFELLDLGDDDYIQQYEVNYPSSDEEESEDEESSSSESEDTSASGSVVGQNQSEVNVTRTLKLAKKGQKISVEDEIRIRKKHFDARISKLSSAIARAKSVREECLSRRAEIIFTLRKTERKISEVRGELDRALAFKGGQMDSSVVHGSGHLQRFTTSGLATVLQEKLNELLELTTRGKHELIQIENTIKRMNKLQEENEELLKGRQAALFEFKKEVEHKKKNMSSGKVDNVGSKDARVVRRMKLKGVGWTFDTWVTFVIKRRREKYLMAKFLKGATNALLMAGWIQWRHFIVENQNFTTIGDGLSGGAGTKLLVKVDFLRRSNMTEALNTLRRLKATRKEVENLEKTPCMQKALEASPFFVKEKEIENQNRASIKDLENPNMTTVEKVAVKADLNAEVTQGDIYYRQGDYDQALHFYNKYLARAIYDNRIYDQCVIWLKIGHTQLGMDHFEKAGVAFRNVELLVDETGGSLRIKGDCFMGSAKAFHELGKYKFGNDFYMKALTIWMKLSDVENEILACKGLVQGYDKVGDTNKARIYEKRYKSIEWNNVSTLRIDHGKYKLQNMRKSLLGAATMPCDVLRLERVSSNVPKMRKKIEEQNDTIFKLKVEMEVKKAQASGSKRFHQRVAKELKRVQKLEIDEVDSTLITGTNQRYARMELIDRLQIAEQEAYNKKEEENKAVHTLGIRASNAEDDISYMHEEITADQGELVRRVHEKKRVRCFALNDANMETNDVLGGNSGGVPYFCAACESYVLVFDILFATCVAVLNDDPMGHKKTIVSLRYHENRCYSGGADHMVCVWDLDKTKPSTYLTCVGRLEGHTGSIWSIDVDAVKIVTGSTDCSVRIWDVETLECLRIVDRPHVRTITALKIGPDLLATGGGDMHVKMWELESTFKIPYKHVNLFRRLRGGRYGGHQTQVTIIEFAATELVSGDREGTILVWNISTGLILRKLINCHKQAVRGLKFDATKIISVGNDGLVLLTDISTGEHLQSLHGHEAEVLAVQYDSREILTLSVDNTVRHWRFPVGNNEAKYKWHLLQPGESLKTLRIKYGQPISKIKEWNNIKDVITDVYSGMRLIVDNSGTGDIYERQRLEMQKKAEAKERELKEVRARLKNELKQAAKDVDKEFQKAMFAAPISNTATKSSKKPSGGSAQNEDSSDQESGSANSDSDSEDDSTSGEEDSDASGVDGESAIGEDAD